MLYCNREWRATYRVCGPVLCPVTIEILVSPHLPRIEIWALHSKRQRRGSKIGSYLREYGRKECCEDQQQQHRRVEGEGIRHCEMQTRRRRNNVSDVEVLKKVKLMGGKGATQKVTLRPKISAHAISFACSEQERGETIARALSAQLRLVSSPIYFKQEGCDAQTSRRYSSAPSAQHR